MTAPCTHLADPGPEPPAPTARECVDCVAEGTRWVHLRECLTCGLVRCCDSSPRRHASAHARTDEHPVVRSFEPGEEWRWCYVDEVLG